MDRRAQNRYILNIINIDSIYCRNIVYELIISYFYIVCTRMLPCMVCVHQLSIFHIHFVGIRVYNLNSNHEDNMQFDHKFIVNSAFFILQVYVDCLDT